MWYGHTFVYSIVLYLTSLIWVMEILFRTPHIHKCEYKTIKYNIKPLNSHCVPVHQLWVIMNILNLQVKKMMYRETWSQGYTADK